MYCSPLTAPQFGTLNPPECTSEAVTYLTRCVIECNSGFGLKRQGSTTCQQNGQWTDDITDSSCTDFTPPVISDCLEFMSRVLPIGEATIHVILPTPTATDNSGIDPVVKTPSASEMNLGPGTYFFPTTATDEAGNVARCITTVSVKDLEPPTILSCPNITTIRTSALLVSPMWEEPSADDNIGVSFVDSDRLNGAPVYQWGLFEVVYTFLDMSGNSNTCTIKIEILDDTPCMPLQAPPNGALACEDDNHCTVHCDDGYVMLTQPPDALVCLNTGLWSNVKVDQLTVPYLPACTKREEQSYARWERMDMYRFTLHDLSGSCQDQTDDIRSKFVALFTRMAFPLCQVDPDNQCKLNKKIVVSCGLTREESGRRQRREADFDNIVTIFPRLVLER